MMFVAKFVVEFLIWLVVIAITHNAWKLIKTTFNRLRVGSIA